METSTESESIRSTGGRGTSRTARSYHARFRARRALVAAGIVALVLAACRGAPPPAYTPELGEIMSLQQMRHIKLWYAGAAGNWPLAAYELDELEEGFADVARHPALAGAPRPLSELVPEFTATPLGNLRAVVSARDVDAFATAFDLLTAGCNGCHKTVGFAFNVVSRPTSNPYSNQDFRPAP